MRKFILAFLAGLLCLHVSAQVKTIDGDNMPATKSIYDNLATAKNFTVLLNAIQKAGLSTQFTGTTPVTILAPNNKAFAALPAGTIDTLLKPEHKIELARLINNHILAGKITSADIARQIKMNNGQAVFTTLAGSKLTAKIDANRNIALTDENGSQSVVSRFDVQQLNGVLHTVTALLIPSPAL
ncbi:fasciclin domain-containing protein [Mucilaginibacter gynuensis]|uniref:Fasciclin domain-containing protein n=1 Tax=Mucilaginibacter gynuensis TaxID=1302236 RepID=A0ABP8H2S8_9SPHI